MQGLAMERKGQLSFILISFFLIVSLFASTITAHPPSRVELNYDQAKTMLEVTISHRVGNPNNHYVESVVVTRNGETVLEKDYSKQKDRSEFTYRYDLAAENDDTFSVNAQCNRFGNVSGSITVSGLPVETSDLFLGKLTAESGGLKVSGESAAEASGVAIVLLNSSKNSLQFSLTFKGLSGTPTGASFWKGSKEKPETRVLNIFGQNGQSILNTPDGNSALISGEWNESSFQPLTDETVEDFLNGRIYVNVRTEMNPEGEIRARLLGVD